MISINALTLSYNTRYTRIKALFYLTTTIPTIIILGWGDWTPWGDCPVTCGTSDQVRTRQCLTGNNCGSDNRQTQRCTMRACAGIQLLKKSIHISSKS